MNYQLYNLQLTNEEVLESTGSMISIFESLMDTNVAKDDIIDVGSQAPNFKLKNTEGDITTLKELPEGKKLLVFSSQNCPHCKDFYPKLGQFAKANKNVSIIIIQANASLSDIKQFSETSKYNFKILQANSDVFYDYNISATPTSILLDTNNAVLNSGVVGSYEQIEQLFF
ncbi:redoxin domain-containing protein [Aquimarina sp. RZ0]|uniref:TlpA family protein disulfide reductase n=1 Tax=Aquimarina sp. RZ0 TaxID=2607730 RepID=UPI00165FEDB4|nr:redoxin domain-containing protein [Aquimarina sp. RZ0]